MHHLYVMSTFIYDGISIKTREAINPIPFFVERNEDDMIFKWKSDFEPLDIHVLGSTAWEVYSNIPKAVCLKYKHLVKSDVKWLHRDELAMRDEYIRRFEEC